MILGIYQTRVTFQFFPRNDSSILTFTSTKLTIAKFTLKIIQVAHEKCAKLMVFVSDCQLLIVFIRPLVEQSVLCHDNFRLLFFWEK